MKNPINRFVFSKDCSFDLSCAVFVGQLPARELSGSQTRAYLKCRQCGEQVKREIGLNLVCDLRPQPPISKFIFRSFGARKSKHRRLLPLHARETPIKTRISHVVRIPAASVAMPGVSRNQQTSQHESTYPQIKSSFSTSC